MPPLPIPVPPILEQAIGIPPNSGRLVALHWSPLGDTVVFDDGRSSGCGNGWAFQVFRCHPDLTLVRLPHSAKSRSVSVAGEVTPTWRSSFRTVVSRPIIRSVSKTNIRIARVLQPIIIHHITHINTAQPFSFAISVRSPDRPPFPITQVGP